jgi:hypothetical protein
MPRAFSAGNIRAGLIRSLAVGLVTLGATAASCDYWALSINGGVGFVAISVSGDGVPPGGSGGYRIRVRQDGVPDQVVTVAPGHELRIEAKGTGAVEVTLLVPDGCRVGSPNPQRVVPATDRTVQASFALACAGAA